MPASTSRRRKPAADTASTEPQQPAKPQQPEVQEIWVYLGLIELDAGTQSRTATSQQAIASYAEEMKEQRWEWQRKPLPVLFFDGEKYYPGDGHHRVAAAGLVETVESIYAEVRPGTLRDAIFYSLSANRYHGLQRTNADKRNQVVIALKDKEWSKMSDRAIAEHCGVSAPLVGKIRQELVEAGKLEKSTVKVDKKGRKIETSNIGTKPKAEGRRQDIIERRASAAKNPAPPAPEKLESTTDAFIKPIEIAIIHPHLDQESIARRWQDEMAAVIHALAAEGIQWDECAAPNEFISKKYPSGKELRDFSDREALMIKEVAAILALGDAWINHKDFKGVWAYKARQLGLQEMKFIELAITVLRTHATSTAEAEYAPEAPIAASTPSVDGLPQLKPTASLEECLSALAKEFGGMKAIALAALDECELEEIEAIFEDLRRNLEAIAGDEGV